MKKESFIKNRIKGVIFGRTRLGEIVNSIYDNYIFLKYSFSVNHLKTKQNHKSYLTKQYHIIEKGLSFPNPKKHFGKLKILALIKKSDKYINQFGEDELIGTIRKCLIEYQNKFKSLKEEDYQFYLVLNNFIKNIGIESNGGTKIINKKHIERAIDINFKDLVMSRVSVRDFNDSQIDRKDILRALDIARYTPSVCNRQGWKLHYYVDKKIMKLLLKFQAGNTGFTESISSLLIVTADTESFTNLERNQVFVDGGLFSMNLILALHHVGIGSCCLNTCIPFTTEIKVKKAGNIMSSERLIMMIGIGYLKDKFSSAYSIKKEIEDILVIH